MNLHIKLISQSTINQGVTKGMFGLFRNGRLLSVAVSASNLFKLIKTFNPVHVALCLRYVMVKNWDCMTKRVQTFINGGVESGLWNQVPFACDIDWTDYKAKSFRSLIRSKYLAK